MPSAGAVEKKHVEDSGDLFRVPNAKLLPYLPYMTIIQKYKNKTLSSVAKTKIQSRALFL